MQHAHRDPRSAILAVLEPGEPVIPSVLTLAERHALDAAWVQGIGAVRDIEIGAFDRDARRYVTTRLDGDWELLSLQGNLGVDADGVRVFHPHVVLGDAAGEVRGGHLIEATCAVTVELLLQGLEGRLERDVDEPTGLKLIRL